MEYVTETKEEACSSASKLVKVTITRAQEEGNCYGEITFFTCNSETSSCRSRCLYRMLMMD